jgi:hypothetical protein
MSRKNVLIRSLDEELHRINRLVASERADRACNVVHYKTVQRTEVATK